MVNRNLLRELEPSEAELEQELQLALGDTPPEDLYLSTQEISRHRVVRGKIVMVEPDRVLVDLGLKCEGVVLRSEWSDSEPPPEPGQEIDVLIEDFDEFATPGAEMRAIIICSKRKAEKIQAWSRIMQRVREGDVVTGLVSRKIKGGLLVDIGVNVFLPGSQVDVRRPTDLGEYLGRVVQCLVLKIDESRRNIVVSRRVLIEQQRTERKNLLLKELQVGQLRKGIVKNIADFGAFIDLGGIDGLLHITDMSWGRINHPSELLSLDQEIEVVVLHIDYEREKVALGLKQKTPSPWENIEEKYPVGSRVRGTVVNLTNFGAFVRLEDGVEGLVHISEMSWTKRINHPSDILKLGDEIEVVVLSINKEKQEISLGLKQTQENPWDRVLEKYPVGSDVKGIVRNITNFGAFIELEEGVDGLLHISDISWTRKITHPGEVLQKGQEVECRVLSIDPVKRRIALGLKQRTEDPWERDIPSRYQPGMVVKGTVTKITNFGVFVRLEEGLEGLLHISELADHKVDSPEKLVQLGQEIEVMVLRVDPHERRIGLSRKRLERPQEDEGAPAAEPRERELRGGVGTGPAPSGGGKRFRKGPPRGARHGGQPRQGGPKPEGARTGRTGEGPSEDVRSEDVVAIAETGTDSGESSSGAPSDAPPAQGDSST
ncbi:MAG: 30S ribosomal protein S1 [Thermoguttaceae bacterium]|nr:30S ribosomal protein S1 [Thermoguttaceae bacterium]MDW8077645.1 30S ribosomal protein S1 [Thermoguttaceae bacterium]